MFGKKNELRENLFDIAMRWYQSGDSGKKAAALDIFPESMLKNEIENYKKRDKKERIKRRDEELQEVLEKCKKLFPIGTLVWNDDMTDHCVNVIIEEPHIEKSKYKTPWGKYDYDENEDSKTVVARSVRIGYFSNNVIEDSVVGLEKLLINMSNEDSSYVNTKPIINLKDFYEKKIVERNTEIEKLQKRISEYHNTLSEWELELSLLESYDPKGLTEEKIQEIVKQYAR